MGTPEFAVPSLEILVENKFNVVAVVTAPDKPQGRGQKIAFSPVKEAALKHNIPVLQPVNLKAPEFLTELQNLKADLQIVVAFRMLPDLVWSMPVIGTFNLHASLLPNYRGAAPINWAIINGENETGVTTFFIQHDIDTGSIILQDREPIYDDDTASTLYDRLKKKGALLVLRTARSIGEKNYRTTPQPKTGYFKTAPKIFKETCAINWNHVSKQVCDFVRGLSTYPAAWTTFNGKTYKVYKVSGATLKEEKKAGEYVTDNQNYLYVKTGDGWVSIDELQPEGKRKMAIQEFFHGNKL